jgi:hypothetical protein
MTAPIPGGEYLTTKEAVIALGISKATLYRRKNEGFFQRGVHYVTTGPKATSNFLWNIPEVRKVQGTWAAPEVNNG